MDTRTKIWVKQKAWDLLPRVNCKYFGASFLSVFSDNDVQFLSLIPADENSL